MVTSKKYLYKEYSVKAGKIIYSLGGRVVASGWKPIRELRGKKARKYMIIVEFPSEKIFEEFLNKAETENIHNLREAATENYIWTLYQNWNIKAWVRA